MFVPDHCFHPSLTFASKASGVSYCVRKLGRLSALLSNIVLTGKIMTGTNTLAYLGLLLLKKEKGFIDIEIRSKSKNF